MLVVRTDYPGCRVHRESTLRVVESSGAELDLRICGSIL